MNHQPYPPLSSVPSHQTPLAPELSGQYVGAGYGTAPGAPPPGQPPTQMRVISPTQSYYHGHLPPPHHMAPSRGSSVARPGTRDTVIKAEAEEPKPVERVGAQSTERDDGVRSYKLVVVQHPIRARMCGFGDKDRRPLTPPPCLKLVIMDKDTGKEVDFSEIDPQYYLIHCDLWDAEGLKEVNLIQNQNNGSISSGSATSYREVLEGVPSNSYYPPHDGGMMPSPRFPQHIPPSYPPPEAFPPGSYSSAYHQPGYAPAPPTPQMPPTPSAYGYPQPSFRGDMPPAGMAPVPSQRQYGGGQYPGEVAGPQGRLSTGGQQPAGMFTRNLIGSVATSAVRLLDTEGLTGIWFIPHDMSVRTEGLYRLRFSFVNVRDESKETVAGVSDTNALTKGKAKILATVFSDPFQVYSAKRFPGVVESTELMKCFSRQGVKIPIRKEGNDGKGGKRKAGDRSDDDDYDYD